MVANVGDTENAGEEVPREIRTVRRLESTREDLSLEEIRMEVDGDRNEQDEERERAMTRGRGSRGGKYMDD